MAIIGLGKKFITSVFPSAIKESMVGIPNHVLPREGRSSMTRSLSLLNASLILSACFGQSNVLETASKTKYLLKVKYLEEYAKKI